MLIEIKLDLWVSVRAGKLSGSCTSLIWERSGNPVVKFALSYVSVKLLCNI